MSPKTAEQPPTRSPSRQPTWLGGALRLAFSVLVVAGLVAALARMWHEDWPGTIQLQGRWVAPALAALLAGMSGMAIIWVGLDRAFCGSSGIRTGIRIWWISQLPKYLPGKIWGIVARAHLAQQAGSRPEAAAIASVLENVLGAVAAIVLSAVVLGAGRELTLPARLGAGALALPGLGMLIWPPLAGRLCNLACRLLKRQPLEVTLTRAQLIAFLGAYLAVWLCLGSGLFCLARAVYPEAPVAIPQFAAALGLAWVLGVLVIVAPGGLGAREAALAYLLAFFLPQPVAITVALLARVWTTLGDLLGAGIVFWWK